MNSLAYAQEILVVREVRRFAGVLKGLSLCIEPLRRSIGRGMATSTLRVERPQHGFTQDGVDPRLVALALALEPQQDIRINAHCRGLLGRSVKRVLGRLLPELIR